MPERAHLNPAEIAGYLAHDLTSSERGEVEAHLDACAECRGELVEVVQLTSAHAEVPRSATRLLRRRWWIPVAMAAGLAAVMVSRQSPNTTSVATHPVAAQPLERPSVGPAESMPRISIVAPAAGLEVPARGVVFSWHGRSADTYRITVMTEDGAPVWTGETLDTTETLPATVVLDAGHRYFWRVDAVSDGIVATSGVHPLVVARK